jgi:hypothetical protein
LISGVPLDYPFYRAGKQKTSEHDLASAMAQFCDDIGVDNDSLALQDERTTPPCHRQAIQVVGA